MSTISFVLFLNKYIIIIIKGVRMINIKDIARMTNLSTTTVSKVINNKVDD